mgnify:FL=1
MSIATQIKRLFNFRQGRVSIAREIRQQARLRRNLERSVLRKLTSLFRKAIRTRAFIYTETSFFDATITANAINEELLPVMLQHYKRVFDAIYQYNENKYKRLIKQEALVFDRNVDLDLIINEYFNERELFLVNVSQRIANRIDKVIKDGQADGLTLREIARNIETQIISISRSRAQLIARTETHNAASYANHNYHQRVKDDYGIPMVKQWVATNDLRTRSIHADANGQKVPMDEDFTVGGVPMSFAGDSRGGAKNVINCRCVILYADENDIVQ